jgi:DNA-binding transcriptional MerR regulator
MTSRDPGSRGAGSRGADSRHPGPRGADSRHTDSRHTGPRGAAAQSTGRAGLTISEFGRQAGLSHKALRLYDLSGLLPPAAVDPVTGYRLYSPDQLERARRISLLRQLEMPLATVAEVLSGSDEEAARHLDRWWAAQEESNLQKRASVAYLRARLTNSSQDPGTRWAVHVREVAATKVASITCHVDQQALVGTTRTVEAEIRQYLAAAGADVGTECWMLFHGFVTPDSEAPVEVCVPFTGTVDPARPIGIRIEPAHTEAYCTIVRDDCFYPRIMLAYDAVGAWVQESGLPEAGSAREIYIADWCAIEGTDPFCLVALPFGTPR